MQWMIIVIQCDGSESSGFISRLCCEMREEVSMCACVAVGCTCVNEEGFTDLKDKVQELAQHFCSFTSLININTH